MMLQRLTTMVMSLAPVTRPVVGSQAGMQVIGNHLHSSTYYRPCLIPKKCPLSMMAVPNATSAATSIIPCPSYGKFAYNADYQKPGDQYNGAARVSALSQACSTGKHAGYTKRLCQCHMMAQPTLLCPAHDELRP